MRVVIFGASGLIGTGVLREALASAQVKSVLSVVRSPMPLEHPKLTQLVHADFLDFTPIAEQLTGVDAVFWCLGIASAGLDEATYTRITYDTTMAAARVLVERSPGARFFFISGASTDLNSGQMWARVKGRTEEALKAVGFKEVVMFRPGAIKPPEGVKPRAGLYRVLNPLLNLLIPLFRLFGMATSAHEIGRAMIVAAQRGAPKQVLESKDINTLAASAPGP